MLVVFGRIWSGYSDAGGSAEFRLGSATGGLRVGLEGLFACYAGVGGSSVFFGRRGCCGIGIPRAGLLFNP